MHLEAVFPSKLHKACTKLAEFLMLVDHKTYSAVPFSKKGNKILNIIYKTVYLYKIKYLTIKSTTWDYSEMEVISLNNNDSFTSLHYIYTMYVVHYRCFSCVLAAATVRPISHLPLKGVELKFATANCFSKMEHNTTKTRF